MPPEHFLMHASWISLLQSRLGGGEDIMQELQTNLVLQYIHVMGNGGHITRCFADALRLHTATDLTPLRTKWESDLGRSCTDTEWNTMLVSPTYVPRNARFKLIQYYARHTSPRRKLY